MTADLRIHQLVTDPLQPEGGEPVAFMVEAANVGDEGTGAFVVRFQLDNSEQFDADVQTIAAGESQWLRWAHAGMAQGDHVVACVLDADHAVPEPEERRNQRTIQFRVREIEFAPQSARGNETYDDDALAGAVVAAITGRVNLWFTLAVQAVEEWEIDAKRVIADYGDVDVTVDGLPVVFAFVQAVGKHLPGMSTGMGIIEDIGTLAGMAQSYMGAAPMGLAGARARLTAAIDQVKGATGRSLREAIDGYEGRVRANLSPDNDHSPLKGVEYGSLEPTYIAALADWLGVHEPNEANTTAPIKAEMMAGFETVQWEVNRQLQHEASM